MIYGLEGPIAKGKGHRVEHFGPVKDWKMEDGPTGMQVGLVPSFEVVCCALRLSYVHQLLKVMSLDNAVIKNQLLGQAPVICLVENTVPTH